jgi:hypothetical protein
MPSARFDIDVLRDGLQWMLEGPDRDPSHPAHDPVIWLTEAVCTAFDDSGLTAILRSDQAREALGTRLHDDLIALERKAREARQVVATDVAGAHARLAEAARAVLEDLAAETPPAATTR